MDHAGLEHQKFVDLAWRKSAFSSFGMVATPWRDARPQPNSIRFASDRDPENIDLPHDLPWMGGHCLPLGVFVTAAGFQNGVTVSPARGSPGSAIITVSRDGGAVVEDLKGRHLQDALDCPALSNIELPVRAQRVLKRSTRYQVGWSNAGLDAHFRDDGDALRLVREEIMRLDTTGEPENSSLVDFFLRFGFGG